MAVPRFRAAVVVKDPGYKQRMGFPMLFVSGILRDHLAAAEGRRTAMRFLPFSRLLLLFSRLLFLRGTSAARLRR